MCVGVGVGTLSGVNTVLMSRKGFSSNCHIPDQVCSLNVEFPQVPVTSLFLLRLSWFYTSDFIFHDDPILGKVWIWLIPKWLSPNLAIPQMIQSKYKERQCCLFQICLLNNPMHCSSLHWLVLGFLYAIFVQWSILATSYPIPPLQLPHHTHFERPTYSFMLKHNVPSCLTLTFADGTFLFYLQVKNVTIFTQ